MPDELPRFVSKALRKSRDERYQSAADLLVDLRSLLRVLQSVPNAAMAAGASPSSRRWVALVGLAVAAIAIGATTMWWTMSRRAGFNEEIHSLLVLPLVNDTGDPEKEYVAEAIAESVIRDLSHLPRLKVSGRETAFQFKGRTLTPQQIAATVPVRAVLSGRVRRAGDQLAIDVELSDTRDGSVIVSRQYLEPAAQAAKIEGDIARDVVRDLRVPLSGTDARELAKVPTTNGQAYQLYLRGQFFHNLGTPEGSHQAVDLHKQAVAIDPAFSVAWLALAQDQLQLGLFFESAKEWMPEAKISALQSLRADPDFVDAHVVLGVLALVYDWDFAAAERELSTSGGTNPRAIDTFTCTVHLMQSIKPGQADREIQTALAADPLSGTLRTEVGCNAYYERHFDAAIAGYRAALEIDPRNEVALWGLGRAYGQLNKYGDALDALAKATTPSGAAPPIIVAEQGYVLARSGKVAEAGRVLDQLNAMSAKGIYVDPYLVSVVYAGMGDAAHALAALDRAYDARSGFMISLSTEPKWDFIRTDPAFRSLEKRVGL